MVFDTVGGPVFLIGNVGVNLPVVFILEQLGGNLCV